MVRSLLSLPHLNPFMQEVHPFVVLFLQLCLEALILDKLQPIHLELMQLIILAGLGRVLASGWTCSVANRRGQHTRQRLRLLLLRKLSLSCELNIILIEDNFLDIVGWHLAHE